MSDKFPIGVFDSGYGGLTVFKEMKKLLPEYDFIYLGDNARTPYGPRSFDVIYQYTLEAVKFLFNQGCRLVILACNTASAKALRTLQQEFLPSFDPSRRVLGVIRPCIEYVGKFTDTNVVGVLGTEGTVRSESYVLEFGKLFPDVEVFQEACPMWVPLVENGELSGAAVEIIVERHLRNIFSKSVKVDSLILGCTHYPLLLNLIKKYTPKNVTVVDQGKIVAYSLKDYLLRHAEIDGVCGKSGTSLFFTTECSVNFAQKASCFLGENIEATSVII